MIVVKLTTVRGDITVAFTRWRSYGHLHPLSASGTLWWVSVIGPGDAGVRHHLRRLGGGKSPTWAPWFDYTGNTADLDPGGLRIVAAVSAGLAALRLRAIISTS